MKKKENGQMRAVKDLERGAIRVAAVLLCLLLAHSIVPAVAFAANGDPVDTISNPANTTIDVFDYWVYTSNGVSTLADNNQGINYNNHSLWFWGNTNANAHGSENHWTGYQGGATQNLVQRQLVDGYPVLNFGTLESLSYLFNGEDIGVVIRGDELPAKRSYMGANELFTVDDDGYYVFNSEKHNAKLDLDTRNFNVTEQTNGMFYPFSDKEPDRCFFGVHMQTDFSVPNDGQVLNPSGDYQDMVYEFTGDDDVWVFIDGILIGDVGGIHSAQDLSINFATGEVVVKNHEYGGNVHRTTIYDMVVAAIGAEAAQERFRWKVEDDGSIKTYASGTYHTMDFFYLERGAGRSNMKIKYNLVSTYDFTAHKTLYKGGNPNEQTLQENQFQYKLTGYANDDGLKAVMPKTQPDKDVTWTPDYNSEPQTLVVGNSADGNVNFGNAELNAEELAAYVGKTFRYVYEEILPNGAVNNGDGTYTYQGITYDTHKYYFEGTISPEGWINKTYYTDDTYTTKDNVNFVNFTNLYNSTGRAVLTAQKAYLSAQGESLSVDPNQFTFKLTNITDPAHPAVIDSAAGNDGSGKVTFSQMVYSLANDLAGGATSKTYTYRIEENPGSEPGITYSNQKYYVRVTLNDDGDGSLAMTTQYYSDAECTLPIQPEDAVFTNTSHTLTVSKTVDGNLGSKDKEFSFTLAIPDMAGKEAKYSLDGGAHQNVMFDASGQTSFALCHGQSVTFYGVGSTYTVEETTDDGYTATYQIDDAQPVEGRTAAGTISSVKANVAFTNTLDTAPPTGIYDSIAFALIGLITAAGLMAAACLGRGRKRHD